MKAEVFTIVKIDSSGLWLLARDCAVVTGACVRTEKTLSVVPQGLSTSKRFLSKNVLFVCVYTCLRVSRKARRRGCHILRPRIAGCCHLPSMAAGPKLQSSESAASTLSADTFLYAPEASFLK